MLCGWIAGAVWRAGEDRGAGYRQAYLGSSLWYSGLCRHHWVLWRTGPFSGRYVSVSVFLGVYREEALDTNVSSMAASITSLGRQFQSLIVLGRKVLAGRKSSCTVSLLGWVWTACCDLSALARGERWGGGGALIWDYSFTFHRGCHKEVNWGHGMFYPLLTNTDITSHTSTSPWWWWWRCPLWSNSNSKYFIVHSNHNN